MVAEVALCWVDRKSVSLRKGSRRVLQRRVRVLSVSTMSSRLFWRGAKLSGPDDAEAVDTVRLWSLESGTGDA